MEKEYYIKSVSIKKDMSWKVYSYGIYYYHEKNPNFTYSATYSAEDFKKLYGDLDLNAFVWQKIAVKRELIFK